MIRLNDPNINLKDFEMIDTVSEDEKIKERYFVPYCRIKKGKELFENQDSSISELPDEIYEHLHPKSFRYPAQGDVELK